MAAQSSKPPGGYQCEFVGAVSEDFVCGLCRHVAREPQLTSCCGETFCKACITPVLEDKKPCPSCETAEFTALLNVKYQRRILALEVRCTLKDRGCEWTGKLEGLKAHLDVNTGDCEHVDVECPNRCDQPIQKHNRAIHLANSCPKREFTCQYCNFKATYEVVSNHHWPQCSFYPVPCPNACGTRLDCSDLDSHLAQCPLKEIKCEFSHAGCTMKLPRQDMERHMEESTQQHLALMSATIVRINREFEQKLQEQQSHFQLYMEQKDRQIQEVVHEKEERIRAVVEEQLLRHSQENEAKIKDLQQQIEQKVEVLQKHTVLQFEMPNFRQHMDEMDYWYSPPLYAYPGGYKFCIAVCANGLGSGIGTYLTVYLYSMKGEFDSQLQWPAQNTITLQLLNQERDRDHITVTENFEWSKPVGERDFVAYFSCQFTAHKDLGYDPQRGTCYLKNDHLLFRVAN